MRAAESRAPEVMDLSYFNSRIRGMRGKLLMPADCEPLIRAESFGNFIDRLKSGPYGPYIETAGARFGRIEDALDSALRARLSDIFLKIWKVAPVESRPLLKAVFSVWEVRDLKSLIRGIARGIKKEDISNTLLPVGEFDQGSLNTLLGARDLKDLAGFLHTWGSPYYEPVKGGMEPYIKRGSIMEAELNLNIFIYRFLLSQIPGGLPNHLIIRDSIILRIDIENILTLIKIAGENYTREGAEAFFIPGGKRLKKDRFLELAESRSRDEVIKKLDELILDTDIKAVLSSESEELTMLEERFEELIEKRLQKRALSDPHSIALGASFIYMAVREIKNLRLIARAKSFAMPEDEIGRLLIYPLS